MKAIDNSMVEEFIIISTRKESTDFIEKGVLFDV